MSGFNVETYQLSKQSCAGGNNNGVNQDILDRLEDLENNQMNIFKEFSYNFKNSKYTDLLRSTVITTNDGIIPRQYKHVNYISFNDDDLIDYDNSDGIKYQNNSVTLENTSVLSGTLRLFPIDMNGAVGMKFGCNYTNLQTLAASTPSNIINENLWMVAETDKYGRLWVLTCEQFKYGDDCPVNMTIYNKDMTVYKNHTLPYSAIFHSANGTYYPIFNAASIKFTDENVAIVVTRTMPGIKDGGLAEYDSSNVFTDHVSLLNEDANTRHLGNYGGYYICAPNYCFYSMGGSTPAEIVIKNDKVFIMPGTYKFYMSSYADYLNNSVRNFLGFEITGTLTDLSNMELVKFVTKGGFPRTTGWEPGNAKYNAFRNSNVFYRDTFFHSFGLSKGCYGDYNSTEANIGNYINQIYSLQAGINISDKTFSCETDNTDLNYNIPLQCVDNKIVTYAHPGFNGMFYASNGRLYIFGNHTNNKTALLNCYDVDWNSRKTGKLTVNNIISKTMELETCSYAGGLVGSYDTLPNSNISNYMKILEYNNKIHVFFIAPQSDTIKKMCLKYMSFDYNLNTVVDETILYIQESDTRKLLDYNVTTFNDEITVLYSVGDRSNYNSANPDSNICMIKIASVYSEIKFYYLDNIERVWRNVSAGEEVRFSSPVDNIQIRALLNTKTYKCAPVIKSFTIETWDNNGQGSRPSEYHSTRIDTIQNDGKGVLLADCDPGDGVIDWSISFDGGVNYSPVKLNQEFVYTHIHAPDFRVRAIMSVTDNAVRLPIIRSYTIKTSHVVLHSDLEEIQINLIKTNFKIDTYTRASKNGLLKMTVDTFSDNTNIDPLNSDYTYFATSGAVGGNYIQTIAEDVSGMKTILLTTDETLDNSASNSRITYHVSLDNGVTFKPIQPNIKTQLTNVNASSNQLIFKAVFYDNARLNAWGWAWN